jgi:hypothetical protein
MLAEAGDGSGAGGGGRAGGTEAEGVGEKELVKNPDGTMEFSGVGKVLPHLPYVEKVTVDSRKVIDYALNPQNLSGGADKARVFNSALGYNQENAGQLISQLQSKLSSSRAITGKLDQFGQRYTVDLSVTGANGNTAIVRTGWIIDTGTEVPRMTTLYVK